jgi:hypothetical protein
MTRRSTIIALTLASFLALCGWVPEAQAWSRQGHMVTGAIAYARLQEADPAALAAVIDLLRTHPHYDQLLRAPSDWNLDSSDSDLALFMRAARWADDIRDDEFSTFSRSNWHYVNYHYRGAGIAEPGPGDGELLTALHENFDRLMRGGTQDRSVALTWMFHLVGDAHQPLHTIAYHADAHPDGDRGGNLFFVRVASGRDTINLHQFWDGLVQSSGRFDDVRNKAIELRNTPGLTPTALEAQTRQLDFNAWAEWGASLAAESVYRRGKLASGERESGSVLPDDYADSVQPIARRQAVLAGYRLARLLSDRF